MPLIILPYEREKAVKYAERWAMSRNPKFYNYDKLGGDCTNFSSQCIYAGSGVMKYAKDGWYYINGNNRSPSWTGVQYLRDFLVKNRGVGPFAEETNINNLETGDIIQLGNEEGYYHSLVIIRIDGKPTDNTIYIATHTFDSLDRVLSSYIYREARYLHIKGVRKFI